MSSLYLSKRLEKQQNDTQSNQPSLLKAKVEFIGVEKENTDQNKQNNQPIQNNTQNNDDKQNEKALQLKEKLRIMRENRQQAEEQKSRKNWDNVDPTVMKKIEDLEDHKRYIKTEQEDVKNNKKQILFKQRHQLMSTTEVMQQKVETIIDKEKDKLLNVFDEQLNQSRRTMTPSNSFYTNSRINRSNSLDASQYSFYSSSFISNNRKNTTQNNQTLDISASSQGGQTNQSSLNGIQIKLDRQNQNLNVNANNSQHAQSRKAHSSLHARQQSNQEVKITSLQKIQNANDLNQNPQKVKQNIRIEGEEENNRFQKGQNCQPLNLSNLSSNGPSSLSQRDQISSLNETKKLDASQFRTVSNSTNNHSQTRRQGDFQESLYTIIEGQKRGRQLSQTNQQSVENSQNSQQVKGSVHLSNFMQESFAFKQQFVDSNDNKIQTNLSSEEQKTLPRSINKQREEYQGPASFLNQNNSLLMNPQMSEYQPKQKQLSIHNSNTLINKTNIQNQSNSDSLENDEAYWGTATNGTTISFNEDQHHSKQSVERINFTTIYNKSDNSIQIIDERKKSDGNLMKIMEKSQNEDNQQFKNQVYFSNMEGYESSYGSQYQMQKEALINNDLKISPFQRRKQNFLNQSQSLLGNQLIISCCPNCKKTLPQYDELSYDHLSNSENSNSQSRNQNYNQKDEIGLKIEPFKNLNTFGSLNEMHFKSSLLNEDSNEKQQQLNQAENLFALVKEKQQRQSLEEGQYLSYKRISELEYTIGQLYKEIEIKDEDIIWLRRQRIKQINQNTKSQKKNNFKEVNKVEICNYSSNNRLKNKIQRLKKQNKLLLNENLNQRGLLQEYELQLDSLFESIFQNEKELKQLKKQQKKSTKAFDLLQESEDKVNQNFEQFKDKLENILTGYSNQLEKLNKNEQHYNQITKENAILKQERDELMKVIEKYRM